MINKILRVAIKWFIILLRGRAEYARYIGVSIGENCRIYTTEFGTEPWLISIGNKVTVTSGVVMLTHDGATWLMNDEKGRRYSYKKIDVKDNVFIGINSIIMPGVVIDKNVIIAAGSVVTKSIPSGVIVGGNPAKIIGDYYDYEKKVLANNVYNLNMKIPYKQRINNALENTSKSYLNN
tara:strand:- start:3297 stop:3833 length:537 start_codon:yes stop_codon:yes gene_type:complete